MIDINKSINKLLSYGLKHNLITEDDYYYCANRLISLLKVDNFISEQIHYNEPISLILDEIIQYALNNNLIEQNSIIIKDIFDTEIMNCLMPRPSEVNKQFWYEYNNSKINATDYFYRLSINSNYIRKDRIKKNIIWKTPTKYGDIDITINLSKPEKDPIAIALAKNMPKKTYPKCVLCKENVGFYGNVNQPARANHRIIKIDLNDEPWYFQYSPYVYYNEHCIVLKGEHEPMKISRETFINLFDFVSIFPHYFIGSNADLPIVGGSILDHDHFQGGNYEFAMTRASIRQSFIINEIEVGILNWPMSVLRLRDKCKEKLVDLAEIILAKWRNYSDNSVGIHAYTIETPHNTITPIARFVDGKYELDLVLRNNRTTDEHPLGIYHPHSEHHHLKKENIGLIEVMGLAVLPARLETEVEIVKECLLNNIDINTVEEVKKHNDWVEYIKQKYHNINKANIDEILKDEIGLKFTNILEQCAVFGNDLNAFIKFIKDI